ncbi:GM23333 [Drosophila sechellia]|uniref:GM23333 n=1 Tax=Drosophila sechellia TaxID=7238 RepID=B4IFB0_DROSE|nr:GM23333 [Drosophila sechellia]
MMGHCEERRGWDPAGWLRKWRGRWAEWHHNANDICLKEWQPESGYSHFMVVADFGSATFGGGSQCHCVRTGAYQAYRPIIPR